MESPSQENNTLHTTPAESRADLEEAAEPKAADGKRGIQWREIIRQAFDKARQTQQPRTTRRELSKDKSKSLVVLGGAAVAMLLLFLGIFSSPQKAKRTVGQAGAPDLGRRITPGQESGQSGSVTPMLNAEVSGDEAVNRGDVTPEMIGRTARPGRPKAPTAQQTTPQYALNKIDFDSTLPQEPGYQRPQQPPSPDESPEAALRKPSLVFVRGADTGVAGGAPMRPAVLEQSYFVTLLPPGTRLVARLESAVSTGVKEPVVAVIEYNFEREGEIVVPAGAKAIGQLRQADRSGNVDIRFDRLEMPDGSTQRMDGVAMDLAFRPLKGSVSGKKTGTKFLVRTFTGLGTVAAYLVGNGGSSGFYGPLSESALLRERVANKVGVAGDEELNELAFNQNIVVTVPGNTRFYIVLGTGAVGRDAGSRQAVAPIPAGSRFATTPTLEELRQLMQLRQELSAMYQQTGTPPAISQTPQ
ncbi:MAG: hypothetical protein WB763_13515 [Terriglobia bacterium]